MHLLVSRGLISVMVLYVYRKGVISLNHLFFMLSFHPSCSLTKKTQLQAYWHLITEEKWAKGTWSDKRTCPLLWDWSELLWNHCSGAPAASLRHSGPWWGHPVTAVRSQGHFCVHRGGGLRCVLYKVLMEMYHDDEDSHDTGNYNTVHPGDYNIIYIERNRTHWGR